MLWRFVYNTFALPVMFTGFYIAGFFNCKIREGIVGRRQVFEDLERKLKTSRDLKKTVWFHAASVGEFEQAKPLIESIYTDTKVVLTYFSPSVASNAEVYPYVDVAVYFPFDTSGNAKRLLNLIKPTCLIFCRYDIWPNLVWKASEHNVPIIIIAATLHEQSKRRIANHFFKCVHQYITLHCAISDSDAERLQQLCASENQVVVTGDTRYEQVYRRAMSVEKDTIFFPGQETLKRPIFLAGSTYFDDERVLFDAYQILSEDKPNLTPTMILVPHEPTSDRIAEIQFELERRNLSYNYYSELRSEVDLSEIDVLIVDAVGILAKLYSLSEVAFVGGSFHGSVHNVMEPAAMGKPVIFGPTIQNAYEATLLLEKSAAKLVRTPEQMASVIAEWLNDTELRIKIGNNGKELIENNLGAVEQTLIHLQKYL